MCTRRRGDRRDRDGQPLRTRRDRRSPPSALAFTKHTRSTPEAFGKGARECALASVAGFYSDVCNGTIARRELVRRALQPQPPDILGGRLTDDRREESMEVKRREARVLGQLW